MRNNAKKEKLYAVIGLGRFGFSLAKRLAEAGKDRSSLTGRKRSSTMP